MAYDFTNLTGNESTLVTLVDFANDATNGILVAGLVIGAFLVVYAASSKFGVSVLGSVAFSSWMGFLFSIFFVLAGLLNFWFMLGFGITAAFATFAMFLQK